MQWANELTRAKLKVILWLHLHVSLHEALLLRLACLLTHVLFLCRSIVRGRVGHADGGSPVQLVISSQRLSTVALMPEQHATPVPELTSFCLHLQLLLLTNQFPALLPLFNPCNRVWSTTPAVRIEANNSPAGATLQHFSLFLHN